MNNLQQKLNHLEWLKCAGIEYYCSTKKDSKNSLIEQLKYTSQNRIKKKILPPQTNILPSTSVMFKQNKLTKQNLAELQARTMADEANNLKELHDAVKNFESCELKKFANNTVFADGISDAKILLVGEAPGIAEDAQGIPFCGESGKLLDKMLIAIGVNRKKNAYITNTVFWRPPANRRPTNKEIDICKPFVEKHIALIQPQIIILIGGTATTSLLGTSEGISHIRQQNYSYTNQYLKKPIYTTAIFHPAYLLRQPTQKKTTWFDLLKIKAYIEKNIGII